MAEPRCPYCNTQGLSNLAQYQAGQFAVIYCAQCGAIFGVIPLAVPALSRKKPPAPAEIFSPPPDQPISEPKTELELPKNSAPETEPAVDPAPVPPGLLGLAGNTDITLAPISPDDARQRIRMVSMYGPGGQKAINVMGETGTCPTCNRAMVKMIIPAGYQNSGKTIYYCPNYDECGQWYFCFSEGLREGND